MANTNPNKPKPEATKPVAETTQEVTKPLAAPHAPVAKTEEEKTHEDVAAELTASLNAPAGAAAAPKKKHTVRVLRGIHYEQGRAYTKDDGWFDSISDSTLTDKEKFEVQKKEKFEVQK